MCRAPGAEEKATRDSKNNSALRGASGPGHHHVVLAWGSKLSCDPSHLFFLCLNLGINLLVRTAAENQLIKGIE